MNADSRPTTPMLTAVPRVPPFGDGVWADQRDRAGQAIVQKGMYRGTMAHPQSLSPGQLEGTWAEAGAVRIIGSASQQRWRWSPAHATWEESGNPPEKVLSAILAAMG
jgi:hypothetical protein